MAERLIRSQATSCHTYPNDKLLQPFDAISPSFDEKVVIPIQTISFYNTIIGYEYPEDEVVIPIQTISFYNLERKTYPFTG